MATHYLTRFFVEAYLISWHLKVNYGSLCFGINVVIAKMQDVTTYIRMAV